MACLSSSPIAELCAAHCDVDWTCSAQITGTGIPGMFCASDGSSALYDEAADIPKAVCLPMAYAEPTIFTYTETDSADSLQDVGNIVLTTFFSALPLIVSAIAAVVMVMWGVSWLLSRLGRR